MARVTVMFPPLTVSRDFIDYPYFADLGAVQIAAVLREAGHDVTLIDALAMPTSSLTPADRPSLVGEQNASDASNPAFVLLGAPVADVLARLVDADVQIVAYTPFHRPPTRDPSLSALLAGAASRGPIVLADLYQSGQHFIDAPSDEILAAYPEVHTLVRYEAEHVIEAVVRGIAGPHPPSAPSAAIPPLPGAASRLADEPNERGPGGEGLRSSPGATSHLADEPNERGPGGEGSRRRSVRGIDVPSLDALPLPAWDLVDLDAYWAFHRRVVEKLGRGAWAFPVEGPSMPLLTSRGCPFRCAHCSSNPGREPGTAKTQRRYSLAYLDRLLGDLRARGARRVHVLDEMTNVSARHFDGLLALLEKHDLKIEIPNGVRADYLDRRQLEALRDRITTLSVSAESGSARVVEKVVDKQLDLGRIEQAAREAHEVGIPLLIHFLIGTPGETAPEINETLAFALRLHEEYGAWPSLQFATPLPGTRLAEMAKGEGCRTLPVIDDWGPLFQKRPSIETPQISLEQLRRFRWTFEQRLEAAGGPQKVIMNVTYKCNNRCTFCATGTRTQVDGNVEQQVAQLLKYRKAGVRLLDFDGGEPTLNPALPQLVRTAKRLGYQKINVTTNGRMCSYPEYAQQLASSGVTSILFSIHGPDAQTHAQNVGVAEAFDQTLEGVRNVVALARPDVALGANVTITKSNWKKLPELTQLIWDLGLRWFNIQFLTPFGRATSSVCPDTQAAADIVMRLIDQWRGRMKLQVINLPFCFMPGYESFLMGDMLKLERHMLFVNTEEVNLFEYLRERRVKKPVCEGCPHAIFCGGFYEMDSVPEPPWLVTEDDLTRPISPEIPGAKKHRALPLV